MGEHWNYLKFFFEKKWKFLIISLANYIQIYVYFQCFNFLYMILGNFSLHPIGLLFLRILKACFSLVVKSNCSTIRARSKEDQKLSRENMRGAASLRKKRQTLSLPPTCTQLVHCEKGKFSLDGSFSKNAPYKQKIIFHLTSIGKMSKKYFFLSWRVGWWYIYKLQGCLT